ncbi:hypothetical protein HAX54_052102, partial [Datura stramonium]|nr:hypothetical protein [Datura stramonium]
MAHCHRGGARPLAQLATRGSRKIGATGLAMRSTSSAMPGAQQPLSQRYSKRALALVPALQQACSSHCPSAMSCARRLSLWHYCMREAAFSWHHGAWDAAQVKHVVMGDAAR